MAFELWHWMLLASAALLGLLAVLVLAEPGLRYAVNETPPPPGSHELMGLIAALADAPVGWAARIEVISDGERFYPAMLETIAQARHSVHLEAFIFRRSAIADRFLVALTERAKAGVRVRVVLDAIGCWNTPQRYFSELRAAGGDVAWYQPIRWHTFKRFNNRTHRELLIVDGEQAFVGGAGVASWWDESQSGLPPWRDTMVQLQGPVASSLQAVFAENWLESTGELLADAGSFPDCRAVPRSPAAGRQAIVVAGTPSAGKATRARMLFQLLIACARRSVLIQSPYFLPDRSMRAELRRATERGVSVQVVVPGRHNNHPIARRASRRRYGDLLEAGVEVAEYQPGMDHTKLLIVDDVLAVVGTSNFDNRSFGLNDEVNVVLIDAHAVSALERGFRQHAREARKVTLADWRARSLSERALALLGILLERQQ